MPRVKRPSCRNPVPGWSSVGHGHCRSYSLQPLVGHAAVDGDEVPDLLEDFLGATVVHPAVAHLLRQLAEDEPVGLALTYGIYSLADALDPALGVHEGAVLLGVAGRGQDGVCQLCRSAGEDLLDYQQLQAPERCFDL